MEDIREEIEVPEKPGKKKTKKTCETVEGKAVADLEAQLLVLTKKCEELEAVYEESQKKVLELEDKHLRMAAEYENFRRRSREEREGVYVGAVSDTVTEILPIIDNLERAGKFTDAEKVREGLLMIASTVEGVLQKLGVEAYGEVGEKFDLNIHNAIMHDEDDSDREGEITDVFQKGYRKGNKIIRFAMVKTVN